MTTTTQSPATFTAITAPTVASTRPALWRVAAVAALAAAVATTLVAAAADLAGVSRDIDGEPIPLLGFGQLTLICVALGYVVAVAVRRCAHRPRRTFVATAGALTVLSFGPDLAVPETATSTRLLLMATHVVAALIVVPAIAARLPEQRG